MRNLTAKLMLSLVALLVSVAVEAALTGTHDIICAHGDFYMTYDAGSDDVIVSAAHQGDASLWEFVPVIQYSTTIQNVGSGYYMAASGTSNGSSVIQQSSTYDWELIDKGNGSYGINVYGGANEGVELYSESNGVRIWDDNDGDQHEWLQLDAGGGNVYFESNRLAAHYLTAQDTTDGSAITYTTSTGDPGSLDAWAIDQTEAGSYYVIKNAANGEALQGYENVETVPYSAGDSTLLWTLTDQGGGQYSFENVGTGRYLEAYGSATPIDGTAVETFGSFNGTDWQLWTPVLIPEPATLVIFTFASIFGFLRRRPRR